MKNRGVPIPHLGHYFEGFSDPSPTWEGVSKSFRTGRLERELRMVKLSVTRFSRVAIWGVSLVSFAAITLFVVYQRVFIVVAVYFFIA